MRIASNKIEDIIQFYYSELQGIYTESEIKLLIHFAFKHYLNYSPSDLLLKKEESINQSDLLKLYDCCVELKKNIPIQYVLGETEFFGLKFKVNKNVLIPRPETEELVELIIKNCHVIDFEDPNILDVGTGSGCIPITLKKNLEDANVWAVDISQEALAVAQQNAQLNNTTVIFSHVNILSSDADYSLDSYDVIVSNPPYIAEKEAGSMHVRVKENEPALALFVANENPLLFYKRIIELCKNHLNPGGFLFFELNPDYAGGIKDLADNSGQFFHSEIMKDLSGNFRFLKAQKHD